MASKVGLDIKDKEYTADGTLLEWIISNRQSLTFSDMAEKDRKIFPFKVKDMKSFLGLPLTYEDEVIGILTVLSQQAGAFRYQQSHLLGILTNHAAIALANARLHLEVKRIAITDGLTGLFNHRHFQECLQQEFERLGRFSEPLSLMLLDIDHFKKVNDTYGHPAGDAVLKGIAQILRATLRAVDIPARYGGEEFAAILIGTDSSGAKNMAERLRKTVEKTVFPVDGRPLKVTMSIGISSYPSDARKKEELIEKADQAMYHAKKSGRNHSYLWSEISRES